MKLFNILGIGHHFIYSLRILIVIVIDFLSS
jgi:hypothetical protein